MSGGRPGAVLVSAQRRFRARRRTGSRRTARRLTAAAVVLGLLVLGGWLLVNSSLFALRYVTVEGTSRLSVAQVLRAAAVREGSSLFRLDPAGIARRVDGIAAVRSAVVTRHWPHGLVIRVTERTATAVAVGPTGATLLDSTGVAFASVPQPPAGLLHVDVDGAIPGSGSASAAAGMHVVAELPTRLRHAIASVDARSADAITVHLSDGRAIVWGSPGEGSVKAAVLRALMRRGARVYDVSTPSVAVTRG